MANTNMDWRDWLCKQLAEADVDMLREMVSNMAEMLMSAEAAATTYGADYRERTDERVNSRNGSRHRPWERGVGTIGLALPKLREGSYFPSWLLQAPAPGRAGARQYGCRLLAGRRLHPPGG